MRDERHHERCREASVLHLSTLEAAKIKVDFSLFVFTFVDHHQQLRQSDCSAFLSCLNSYSHEQEVEPSPTHGGSFACYRFNGLPSSLKTVGSAR